jgi:mgtE-like transporter
VKRKQKRSKRYSHKNSDGILNILRQSLIILFISVIGESITGSILVGMKARLSAIPGILLIIPSLTDLRGNIGAAFGERLSTLLHLGIVKPKISFNPIIRSNIYASFSLTAGIAFLIGIISPLFAHLFNIGSDSPLVLSFISTTAGITSSILLIPLVFIMVFYAFKHHIDPDNIVAPALPVIGDIVTITAIYISAMLAMKLKNIFPIASIAVIIFFIMGARRKNTFPKRYHYLPILMQSTPVLLICIMIGITSGIFLQNAEKTFELFAILLSLVPQVIAQGGAIGGIVGSRVSTALYLGTAKPFIWNKEVIRNFASGSIMGVIVGPFIALITLLAALITHTPLVSVTKIFLLSFISLLSLSLLTSIIAIYIAFISFKLKLDPSNIVIPIITSLGDITGVLILLFVIKVLFL